MPTNHEELLNIGQTFAGKYKVLELIGRGGAGAVYRVRQESVDRDVALKVLSLRLAQKEVMVERFRREAHNVSKLKHPNTVTVFDYGHADGLYYITMELLEGRTLGAITRKRGGLPEDRVYRIVEQTLRALAEAHDHGIVHRDLKPDNIFVANIHGEKDFVKLLDFGIAKAITTKEEQLTAHGTVFGTPSYMSPEQAMGTDISPATDVYAMGLILWEVLVGKMAIPGDTVYSVLSKQVNDPVPPLPGELAKSEFASLIERATLKDAEQRYRNAGEFLEALRHILPRINGGAGMGGGGGDAAADQPTIMVGSFEDPSATLVANTGHDLGVSQTTRVEGIDDGIRREIPRVSNLLAPFRNMAPALPKAHVDWLGRSQELDRLSRLATGMQASGELHFGLVRGAAGLGKSRMLRKFAEVLEADFSWNLVIGGVDPERPAPLDAVRSVVLQLLTTHKTLADEYLGLVQDKVSRPVLLRYLRQFITHNAPAPDATRLSAEDRAPLVAMLVMFLAKAARLAPTAIALDDLEQADDLTFELLDFLTTNKSFAATPLLLLGAVRTGPLEHDLRPYELLSVMGQAMAFRFDDVKLQPFDRAHSDILVTLTLPASRALKSALWQLTGGIPHHLQAAISFNLTRKNIRWQYGQWTADARDLRVPPEIVSAIHEQLDQIFPPSSPERQMFIPALQWAAMLGQGLTRDRLRDVLKGDSRFDPAHFESTVALLQSRGLLMRAEGRDGYRLCDPTLEHILCRELEEALDRTAVHDVAYKSVSTLDRSEPEVLRQLANHLVNADRPVHSADLLIELGNRACQARILNEARHAWVEADQALAAADIDDNDPRRLDLAVNLADVELELGLFGAALHRATRAELRVSPRREAQRIQLELVIARALRLHFQADQAVEHLRKTLVRLASTPSRRLAIALRELGLSCFVAGLTDDFHGALDRLDRLAEDLDVVVQLEAIFSLGLLQAISGKLDLAQTQFTRVLNLLDRNNDPLLRAQTLLELGRLEMIQKEGGIEHLVDALTTAEDLGLQPVVVASLVCLARTDLDERSAETARWRLERAWTIADELDLVGEAADVILASAELHGYLGDIGESKSSLNRAIKLFQTLGYEENVPTWWRRCVRRCWKRISAHETGDSLPPVAQEDEPQQPMGGNTFEHAPPALVGRGSSPVPTKETPSAPAPPPDPEPIVGGESPGLFASGPIPSSTAMQSAIERPDSAPGTEPNPSAAPPQAPREVGFTTYTAPMVLQFIPPGQPVQEYKVYLGPAMPTAELADHLWDDKLLAETGLKGYTLPSDVVAFEDGVSPAGSTVYLAAFAILADGTRIQPKMGAPATRPSQLVRLT